MRNLLRSLVILVAAATISQAGSLLASQVLVLVNKDTSISLQVARMYQKARAIPAVNVLTLSLGTERQITPEQYWTKAAPPIRKFLEEHPEIRCILTTSGVPYTIRSADGKDQVAAFDNELAVILLENPGESKRRQPNPLYILGANASGVADPRLLKMVFVARLDGPDLKTITRMVEDAVAVERTGLEGPVFGDTQGSEAIIGTGIGDHMIRGAIDHLSGAGFESKLDMKPESWKRPKEGPGDQAAGAAFYVGWYDYVNFQDIFGAHGLARGAIAWHIASGEAQDLWDPKGTGWAMNLMRHGAAVTIGPVSEPYLQSFPKADIFTEALLAGGTVAESYWLSSPNTSWTLVLLGDPLYQPFALQPRPSLVARAYIAADNASHVLGRNESGALLVQIECVGPAGSTTPAMTATVEAEMGLVAATGEVSIPALKAGESTVVRIPHVTAGPALTLFRLALNAQDDQKRSRRIVLEGRNGFSRITGSILPKVQLFISSEGDSLIAGQPGRSLQIDPTTLTTRQIVLPQGFGIAKAEYSPDGGLVALSVVNPQQQKGGIVISNPKNGTTQDLPAGSQFLRWLEKDQVLLKQGDQLVRHSLAGGIDRSFAFKAVEGCPDALGGSVIPGTDILYVATPEGKSCIKKGSEPSREVMAGVKATRFGAVANDLTLFGGVDAEKRLWVQHGLDAKPEIVASGVEQVLWGPISRRALVVDANKKARVYDGRDRRWIDLGGLAGAQWSPDEERLLFLEAGDEGYLSILIDHRIERLVPLSSMAWLKGMAMTASGETGFLLAGFAGGLDVWMMALPPKTPGK